MLHFLVVATHPWPPVASPTATMPVQVPGAPADPGSQDAGNHVEVRVAPGEAHGESEGQGALWSPGFGKTV